MLKEALLCLIMLMSSKKVTFCFSMHLPKLFRIKRNYPEIGIGRSYI